MGIKAGLGKLLENQRVARSFVTDMVKPKMLSNVSKSDGVFAMIGSPGLRRRSGMSAEQAAAFATKRGKRRAAMVGIGALGYTMAAPPNPNSRRGIAQAGGRYGQGMGMSAGGSGMLNPRSSGGYA